MHSDLQDEFVYPHASKCRARGYSGIRVASSAFKKITLAEVVINVCFIMFWGMIVQQDNSNKAEHVPSERRLKADSLQTGPCKGPIIRRKGTSRSILAIYLPFM